MKSFFSILLVLCFAQPALAGAKNFIVIYMDDQRIGTNFAMPNVMQLAKQGVEFRQAFITTPLCSPSRSSFLAGGFYPQSTGVLDNSQENGWGGNNGFGTALSQKLPVALQRAGYRTAAFGKVPGWGGSKIPPGWDWARMLNGNYISAQAVEGSSGPDALGSGKIKSSIGYSITYIREQALSFLDTVAAEPTKPFFMFFAPDAMHAPHIADPDGSEDGLFTDFTYSDRGFGETDLTDKPAWVQEPGGVYHVPESDAVHREQLRTLHAADRAIGAILAKLAAIGKENETMVVFASDNGYSWGEHTIWGKGNAYEESIRVPLIIRSPGVAPRKDKRLVAVNLDVPATILDQSGAVLDDLAPGVPRVTQGMTLTPLLNREPTGWRKRLFFESHGPNGDGSYHAWGAILTSAHKYIAHRSGAEELYDRKVDPFELQNLSSDPAYKPIKRRLAKRLAPLKALTVRNTERSPALGSVGRNYSFDPVVWGGTAPYHFDLFSGNLPPGLSLNRTTGLIEGIPTLAGKSVFQVAVSDSSVSPFHGGAQQWIQSYTIVIK